MGIGKGTLGVLGRELMKGLGRELWVYWEGNFEGIGKGPLGVLGREL